MTINKYVKHDFQQALQYIDDGIDAILNINQLHIISRKHMKKDGNSTLVNMLVKSVKIKSPTVNEAFNYYLLNYTGLDIDSSTGKLIYDNDKKLDSGSLTFLEWLRKNEVAHSRFDNIDYTKLEKASISYNIAIRAKNTSDNGFLKNIIQYRSECCPGCGNKFRISSCDIIDNHTCNSVNTARSMRTISGGGGPGTGKRR